MLKALAGVFVCAIVGVFALLMIARHNLATARIPEEFRVTVSSPGSNAETLEKDVAEKLEAAITRVKGVESIRSTITSGAVSIDVYATAIGVDSPSPLELAQQAIASELTQLPPEIDPPLLQRIAPNFTTRYFIANSETLTRLELSRWLEEGFRRELEPQAGVREINFCGAVQPQLQIILDQPTLRALGLGANEVVSALQSSSEDPSSREAIGELELGGGKVHLRDVARIELSEAQGRCSTGRGVLVSVDIEVGAELKLPTHPAVKLTPFKPARTATYVSAPGNSVMQTISVLTHEYPGAVIAAESELITVRFPEEPRLELLPGLALRSVDDHHMVVRVSGSDLEQLEELAKKLSAALAKRSPRWLGTPWPNRGPEQVINPIPGVKGVAQALSLAIVGVETGRLADGTRVVVRAGTSIQDAVLPDGRPVYSAVQITTNSTPVAILRVNRQRTVELELGLEPREVLKVVNTVSLPTGFSVSVTEAN